MRILLTRTDRIGDVVLTTPAIKMIRLKYPDAHIAFMVRPYAKDIVEGNPYLNEVITYDKYGKHKSLLGTAKFVYGLRKKKFDLAIMFHPTNRVHLIAFLAGIPRRIGFDRKLPFLLTERIPHLKQKGEKHEIEYTLDLLRPIGIVAKNGEMSISLKKRDLEKAKRMLDEYHVGSGIPLIAVNPGASCPSKRWPPEKFAALCDNLAKMFRVRILIVSDKANEGPANAVANKMRHEPVNLAGKTTIGELASLLSKCSLFISNDSGPVHIACALKIPVISIFGRGDPGLSPKRWGPTYEKSAVFHKDAGCNPCLAHNCTLGFRCLEAITPEEVLSAAQKLLLN